MIVVQWITAQSDFGVFCWGFKGFIQGLKQGDEVEKKMWKVALNFNFSP